MTMVDLLLEVIPPQELECTYVTGGNTVIENLVQEQDMDI